MEIIFAAPSQRSDKKEILDDFDCDVKALKENLRDIAIFNSLLKTRDAILFYIKIIIGLNKINGKIRILDLCAGSADIATYIIDWARKNNKDIEVTAADISKEIIEVAKEETKNYPEIKCETADAFNLNYDKDYFNIIICSQAFHHFSDEDCIKLLKIMNEFSINGFIVNDLRRAWINYAGAFLISRVLNMNYMSKHDAQLSILRSFTKNEFLELGKKAGIKNIKCYSFFLHSIQLVNIK